MSSTKKTRVREMFDDISPKYDFLNHFLSFGIDRCWRRKLVRLLAAGPHDDILDVATGTGDLAIAISGLKTRQIVGIDIAGKMLAVGREKISRLGLEERVLLQPGDAEKIPFPDGAFDAVTVAFGVRNFEDLTLGLSEMKRVLRPGGRMLILEFSHPRSFPMKQLYALYSRFLIPAAGQAISGSATAYRYLPESVAAFPSGEVFLNILEQLDLKNPRQCRLTLGIASIYLAEK